VLLERASTLNKMFRPTPIARIEHPSGTLYAKLEYHNPFGSLKDRTAYGILNGAIRRGELHRGSTVVESSSGNFALAVASFCRLLELPFIPVIDPNITAASEQALRVLCDRVVKVDQRDEKGGYLGTRLAMVEELCTTLPHPFWTNQYANVDGVEAHYRTTAGEICSQIEHLDYAFIGVSTAGTIAGVSRRLKERFPAIKVVAVDSEGSVIFGGPPKKRYIPGIGASVVPTLIERAIIDQVVIVPERETVVACQALLHEHGLFVGGSSGTVYAAVRRALPAMVASAHAPSTPADGDAPHVLMLFADRGTAYLNTVFNPAWTRRLREDE
jgi:cysteine synthase A